MLRALFSGFRLFLKGATLFDRGLGLGFTGCVLAAMATNLFGDRWSYFEIGAYFWLIWAVVDRSYTAAVAAAAEKRLSPKTAPVAEPAASAST
jgi:hypothetical protein